MQLYIANCTKQNHDFIYWIPERDRPITQTIPIGGQISISAVKDHLEGVIKQHERYGLVDIRDIDRGHDFHGMAFSFDKPVPVEAILHAVAHNDDALQLRGDDIRTAAAITTDARLSAAAQELNAKLVQSTSEVVEQPKNHADRGEKFTQLIKVNPEGVDPAESGKRGRGRPPGARNRPK